MLAQIIGFIAFGIFAISFWTRDKNKLLLIQSLAAVIYIIHYFCLNAFSGVTINIIGIFRGIIFSRDKLSNKHKDIAMFSMILLYILSAIISFQNIFSILPVIAEVTNTVLLNKTSTKKIRIGSIVISILWLIYNISVGSYAGIVTNVIFIVSTIIAIIKLDTDKKGKVI